MKGGAQRTQRQRPRWLLPASGEDDGPTETRNVNSECRLGPGCQRDGGAGGLDEALGLGLAPPDQLLTRLSLLLTRAGAASTPGGPARLLRPGLGGVCVPFPAPLGRVSAAGTPGSSCSPGISDLNEPCSPRTRSHRRRRLGTTATSTCSDSPRDRRGSCAQHRETRLIGAEAGTATATAASARLLPPGPLKRGSGRHCETVLARGKHGPFGCCTKHQEVKGQLRA